MNQNTVPVSFSALQDDQTAENFCDVLKHLGLGVDKKIVMDGRHAFPGVEIRRVHNTVPRVLVA